MYLSETYEKNGTVLRTSCKDSGLLQACVNTILESLKEHKEDSSFLNEAYNDRTGSSIHNWDQSSISLVRRACLTYRDTILAVFNVTGQQRSYLRNEK